MAPIIETIGVTAQIVVFILCMWGISALLDYIGSRRK